MMRFVRQKVLRRMQQNSPASIPDLYLWVNGEPSYNEYDHANKALFEDFAKSNYVLAQDYTTHVICHTSSHQGMSKGNG